MSKIEKIKISEDLYDFTVSDYEEYVLKNHLHQINFMDNNEKISDRKLIDLINDKKICNIKRNCVELYRTNSMEIKCKYCHKLYKDKKSKKPKGFGHTNLCRSKNKSTQSQIIFIKEKESEKLIYDESNDTIDERNKFEIENELNLEKINSNVFKCFQKNKCILIKKITNDGECEILTNLKEEKHFPKIIKKYRNKIIYMKYYEHKKFGYPSNVNSIKIYIKSLLETLNILHEKGYVHGDIKPDNFIFIDKQNYYLIDFEYSCLENSILKGRGTFPYTAPEKINCTFCYDKRAKKSGDIWSVGIMLLCLLSNQNIFNHIENDNYEYKYIKQYIEIYGKTEFKYDKYIKDINNYKKKNIEDFITIKSLDEKSKAINLISGLLKLKESDRITAKDALSHPFFADINIKNNFNQKNEFNFLNIKRKLVKKFDYNIDLSINDNQPINKDYINFCISLSKKQNFLSLNKYEQIKLFKICIICNCMDQDNLNYCETCENAYHEKCIKNRKCICSRETKIDCAYIKKLSTYIALNKKISVKNKICLNLKLPKISNNYFDIDIFLKKRNLKFSDDLVYKIDQKLNYYLLEYGISELDDKDKKQYYELKKYTKEKKYNYVKIYEDEHEGYIVKADTDLELNTLICEYSGDVILLKDVYKLKQENNDSIMDLILTPTSDTTLVICPYEYANLGRFFSGINNSKENSKEKENIKIFKISIEKSVHILFITSKKINKGETLYFNYNSAYNLYPTNDFI